MAQGQFLIRNRHNNTWYGRVIIPHALRHLFEQRRELRVSLQTPDKHHAKRLSLQFWLQCQAGFERLQQQPARKEPFGQTNAFIEWLSQDDQQGRFQTTMAYYLETIDVLGNKHVIDLDDPEKEKELALQLQTNAVAILDAYKDNPEILDRLMKIGHADFSSPANQPETPTPFHEAVGLYLDKLFTRGRKGLCLHQAPCSITRTNCFSGKPILVNAKCIP